MIKKIDILGIKLDNYTVREAILRVETFFGNQTLNTIENISMQMLIESESDPVVREVISSLDLAVIGEKEIMRAAGVQMMQRLKETDEHDFSCELFKRAERNHMSVFLLGKTEEKLLETREELLEGFPKLVIAGEYAVENCVGNWEKIINDMNATTPDIILSVLPTPMQEHFFMDHRDKMNANLWYGIGESGICKKKQGVSVFFRNLMHRGRLKNSIEKYQDREIEEAAKPKEEDEAR
ncbi:MAG: WecB/TagA/CpsF family glycosyltransferase [Roseburia sp.]